MNKTFSFEKLGYMLNILFCQLYPSEITRPTHKMKIQHLYKLNYVKMKKRPNET